MSGAPPRVFIARLAGIAVFDPAGDRFSAVEHGQGAAGLIAAFGRLKAADLANIVHELPEKRRIEVAAALGDERLADVLEELPTEQRERLLTLMEPQDAAPLRRLLIYPDHSAGGLMTTDPVVVPPDASPTPST